MINEKQNYLRLRLSVGRKYGQLDESKNDRFMEHGIEIGIFEVFKQNERQILKPKTIL